MGLLEYIRSRDSGTKVQLSLFIAGGVTLFITAIWMSTFSARVSQISLDKRETEDVNMKYAESRSIGEIFGSVKSQLGSLMSAKDEIINANESETRAEDETYESVVIDDGSALGALSVPEGVVEEVGTSTSPQNASPELLQESIATATPVILEVPVVPEFSKEPRVILIGTTTTQKSE